MNCEAPYPQTKIQWAGFIVYFICNSMLEYWLGRTPKTVAGSIMEMIMMWIMTCVCKVASIFRRKQ